MYFYLSVSILPILIYYAIKKYNSKVNNLLNEKIDLKKSELILSLLK